MKYFAIHINHLNEISCTTSKVNFTNWVLFTVWLKSPPLANVEIISVWHYSVLEYLILQILWIAVTLSFLSMDLLPYLSWVLKLNHYYSVLCCSWRKIDYESSYFMINCVTFRCIHSPDSSWFMKYAMNVNWKTQTCMVTKFLACLLNKVNFTYWGAFTVWLKSPPFAQNVTMLSVWQLLGMSVLCKRKFSTNLWWSRLVEIETKQRAVFLEEKFQNKLWCLEYGKFLSSRHFPIICLKEFCCWFSEDNSWWEYFQKKNFLLNTESLLAYKKTL